MRKPEEIEDIFDLTDEELDNFTDEQLESIPCDVMKLPMGTRARYLQKQTKHKVRAYIKGDELGVDFTNLHEPRFADNAVIVRVSDEVMEELKGDNWREQVRIILADKG